MPTYDYRCDNGHRTEVLARMSDPAPAGCEACGAPLTRVLHAPAVRFLGSGFYATDYAGAGAAR